MKRALLILGIAFAMISCNKNEQKTENFKTAYIDTAELLKEYDKYKAEEEKFKVKSEEMSRPLESKFRAFENEAKSFESNARVKVQAWAQQKGAELQQREQQLSMEQDALLRQIQTESDSIRTTIVKELTDYIKAYGKKEGYEYVYGTGDAASVLYAKDQYDITDKVLKLLNDQFTAKNGGEAKKEEEVKSEDKKEEKK